MATGSCYTLTLILLDLHPIKAICPFFHKPTQQSCRSAVELLSYLDNPQPLLFPTIWRFRGGLKDADVLIDVQNPHQARSRDGRGQQWHSKKHQASLLNLHIKFFGALTCAIFGRKAPFRHKVHQWPQDFAIVWSPPLFRIIGLSRLVSHQGLQEPCVLLPFWDLSWMNTERHKPSLGELLSPNNSAGHGTRAAAKKSIPSSTFLRLLGSSSSPLAASSSSLISFAVSDAQGQVQKPRGSLERPWSPWRPRRPRHMLSTVTEQKDPATAAKSPRVWRQKLEHFPRTPRILITGRWPCMSRPAIDRGQGYRVHHGNNCYTLKLQNSSWGLWTTLSFVCLGNGEQRWATLGSTKTSSIGTKCQSL